jgi:hypothetical protein
MRSSVPRLIVGVFLLVTSVARAQVPEGWFVWPATEPRDGSALDASVLNIRPKNGQLPALAVKDGHFVTPDGQRVRLWGCNLAATEAFPATPELADFIARCLAKGGVNIARLHHLDNAWGVNEGGSLWPAEHKEHRDFNATQLDRLHRLIAALRNQGIYVNLNLKVSKTLVPEDGFDPSVTEVANFQKRVDMFDPRMIELQKDYARRLLTTKNPYTGLAPAEDPTVAVVEINNENSLLGYWTRDLGRGLEKLPTPFREELRGQWNRWLAAHYADDAALVQRWAPAAGAGSESLIPASTRWQLSVQPGTTAAINPNAPPTQQEIRIEKTGGIDWHAQASLTGLKLEDGAVYTVEFTAKAATRHSIYVGVGIDPAARKLDGWRSFGLSENIELGTEWQTYRLAFPAHSIAGSPAALSFNAGRSSGAVSIKDLRLTRDCPGAGLQSGQSPRANTVPLPLTPSARQWGDWIEFLADTERSFAEQMRAFLKDELHVRAAIACSQIDYGGLGGMNRERLMDFADAHAYWQHPDFGGDGGWNLEKWSIRNSPQLEEFRDRTFGELGGLALVRVAGKPYTISEYDHPAPSEYACEMYPEVASFAARQDWDIVYPFSTGAYDGKNPTGQITDFFDQLHHPAKWGQSPLAARLFRRELVASAEAVNELRLGSPLWAEQPHADVLWRSRLPAGPLNFLNVRYVVSDQPGAPGAKATLVRHPPSTTRGTPVRFVHSTSGKIYVIDAPEVAAVVGNIGGASVGAGALKVTCGRFGRDFASISAISLDGRPLDESSRVLITLVARAANQGIKWNDAHNSVNANWGHGPTVVERVPATITLTGNAKRSIYALASDGSRKRAIRPDTDGGDLVFHVEPQDQTMHYEIVAD